jgi:hypothetical protein
MGKILLTDGARKLQRAGRMTMSEIMTIIIFFQIPTVVISKTFILTIFPYFTNQHFQIYSVIPACLR